MDRDTQVRLAAFAWLDSRIAEYGEVLPYAMLTQGFEFEGERVPLMGPQGIFKPRLCALPLSITTSPNGPYQDEPGEGGSIEYRYRGRDPQHPDNVGLRRAMTDRTPLVYFYGHLVGRYHVVKPVFIVGDDPAALTFTVRADELDRRAFASDGATQIQSIDIDDARRRYITTTVQRRLHQAAFRERVLQAYSGACALCHLRHPELLDAAHIDEDSSEQGEPLISNGLALCKIHHAAYDTDLITVRPDYRVEVRPSVLRETDGPMLLILQQAHERRIDLPYRVAERPDPIRLARRYERFIRAS